MTETRPSNIPTGGVARAFSPLSVACVLLLSVFSASACGGGSGAPSGAPAPSASTRTSAGAGPDARFVEPSDGDTVAATFQVAMTAEGMVIEPPTAGIREGAGHYHILVDVPFLAAGQVIPVDDQHIHIGTGESTAELTLPPGTYTLRVQVANGAHIAYDPAEFGDTISVTVR